MNAHVFLAARTLGLRKVVWASSETTLGLAFSPEAPPRYAPVDEDHYPHPESTYALSKVLSETMAEHISTWSGIPFVGLRFSNIFTDEDYQQVPSFQADATSRMWNLWGYIDVRDAAASCRNALEADTTGSVNLIIANDDTIMERPSAELMADVFPDVESVASSRVTRPAVERPRPPAHRLRAATRLASRDTCLTPAPSASPHPAGMTKGPGRRPGPFVGSNERVQME